MKDPTLPKSAWNPDFSEPDDTPEDGAHTQGGRVMELPDCPNCELAGALCDYHVREELAGTRQANEDLHKRIEKLEGALTEAVHVADDAVEKTDLYLGYNDAVQRHAKWITQVSELIELPDKTALGDE